MSKMNRQVDVKALVSHVIRGDGVNKCRICMGDTSEGQVHLSDTVVMEGDKPVTLSELLEIVTGIQVTEETELPGSLCSSCINSTLVAWNFKVLCRNSHLEWSRIPTILSSNIVEPTKKDVVFYICCNKENIFKGYVTTHTLAEAAESLTRIANSNVAKTPVKHRKKHPKASNYLKNECHICGKVFSFPYYLNKHLLSTTKRACTLCGKVLSRERLHKHLEESHMRFVHYCEICHKLFDGRTDYDSHKELHAVSSLQCGTCRHCFKNERSLRAHMYAHTLFNCPSCNTSFENRKCFLYHKDNCTEQQRISATAGTYECHDCGKKYTKKPSLRIHIVQKHLDILPFVCQICGKRCSTKNHLKSHELVHKSGRKVYQCYCGAKMLTSLGFHMHQRIHSGEKPYECQYCGDRFLSASRRLDHVKRRHKVAEMTHICDKCGARFLRPFELKKHVQTVHSIHIIN